MMEKGFYSNETSEIILVEGFAKNEEKGYDIVLFKKPNSNETFFMEFDDFHFYLANNNYQFDSSELTKKNYLLYKNFSLNK